MKKGLLATTALAGAGAAFAGVALAAEAPEWKLSGNMNFQFYYVDQDAGGVTGAETVSSWSLITSSTWIDVHGNVTGGGAGDPGVQVFDLRAPGAQDHGWYFGVDEAELALKVDGVADNGLKYGFKIEIQVNTDDTKVADEARIQLSGGWGTLQLGDEDGAEDIMNYGGENLMGATGGFDGDIGDVLYRAGGGVTKMDHGLVPSTSLFWIETIGATLNLAAPGGPSIAGDTSDATKISYYSPRFSGFQVGASITPTPNNGDDFKADGTWENHYGLGANYDNSFGNLRIRASAVYSAASNADGAFEDIGAWSVGGIVGFGPFSVGASYTDNSDSGQPLVYDNVNSVVVTAPIETYYWNVAAQFKTGPMAFAVGYFMGVKEFGGPFGDSTYEHIALTADYQAAPGLAFYAEIDLISDELIGDGLDDAEFLNNDDTLADHQLSLTNDATVFIMGVKVSF